jgi:hypothetical protein
VNTASGVFLWVRLATRSLIDGISNHDVVLDFKKKKRLRQIPSELVDSYEHMLNSIDPFYRNPAAEIFQIVDASELQYTYDGLDIQLSFIELPFSRDDDPATFRSSMFADGKQIASRTAVVGDQVRARCSGLLEYETEPQEDGNLSKFIRPEHNTTESSQDPLLRDLFSAGLCRMFNSTTPDQSMTLLAPDYPNVRYIHWATREYLESKAVRQRFRDIVQSNDSKFNANIAYIRGCVLSLELPGWVWGPRLWQRVLTILWHCHEADMVNDFRYIALLDKMDRRVARAFEVHHGTPNRTDETTSLDE